MTIEQKKELLDYNQKTGIFIWKVNRPPLKAGQRAGCEIKIKKPSGYKTYRSIRIKKRHNYEHRLAWEFINGEIPKGMQVDHENGNPSDNRISNLRLATQSENNMNRRTSPKSGHIGVYKHNQSSGWCAEVSYKGKKVFRGYYPTKDEAVAARKEAFEKVVSDNSIFQKKN